MILAFASAAAAYAAVAQPTQPVQRLESIFISACLDGSVTLGEADAQAVGFDALPKALRSQLATPAKSKVWKLNTSGNSYLYMMEYSDRNRSPQVCGLASDAMPISPAADAVALRIGASLDRDPGSFATEWWLPEDGYMALASRIREYTVLQVNRLSDRQRKEALKNR